MSLRDDDMRVTERVFPLLEAVQRFRDELAQPGGAHAPDPPEASSLAPVQSRCRLSEGQLCNRSFSSDMANLNTI